MLLQLIYLFRVTIVGWHYLGDYNNESLDFSRLTFVGWLKLVEFFGDYCWATLLGWLWATLVCWLCEVSFVGWHLLGDCCYFILKGIALNANLILKYIFVFATGWCNQPSGRRWNPVSISRQGGRWGSWNVNHGELSIIVSSVKPGSYFLWWLFSQRMF